MPPVQSRRSYTAGFKLEVIAFAEKNGGNMAAERKFGVTERVIRGWMKQKDALQQTQTSFRGRVTKRQLIPEGNLDTFVVRKRKAARRCFDTEHDDFQPSDTAPVREADRDAQSAESQKIELIDGDFQQADAPKPEPFWDLETIDSMERDPNCGFQSTVVPRAQQVLEDNLEKFVVVNTEKASRYSDTVHNVQSTDALKMEPDWEVQSTEVLEREPLWDVQSAEAQKMEPILNLQTNDTLERDSNCDFQSAETQEMEPDWVVQLAEAPESGPLSEVQSNKALEMEPIVSLQSSDSSKRDINIDFISAEALESELISDLQLRDSSEREFNCDIQYVVTGAPLKEPSRDFQTVDSLQKELKQDLQSNEAQKRPCDSLVGNKGTKVPLVRSRKSYTAGFKLEVVAFAEKNGGNMAAERKFGVSEKVIRGWRKQKTALQQTKTSTKSFRGHAAQWPDLEDKLADYVIEQRAANSDLSGIKIRLKAREMAKEMHIHNFDGTMSWCCRFMRRKNIVLRPHKTLSKEEDALQQMNESLKSFQKSVPKKQVLEDNLEKFVVVNTEKASRYSDTVHNVQSTDALKMEPDWEVQSTEVSEREPLWDVQSAEAQKMEPILNLQTNDMLERDSNCDFQSAETQEMEPDWVVQLAEAPESGPLSEVQSNKALEMEPIVSLQSSDSSKRDINIDFKSAEALESELISDLQLRDSSERELNCDIQYVVTGAPLKEPSRDFQTVDSLQKELKQDLQSNEAQKRPCDSLVGNKGTKVPLVRSRKSYTAGFKLEVVAFAEKNGGNMAAERKFGVSEKVIRGWRKQKTALQQTKTSTKSFRGHAAQWPDLEDKLADYVIEQRAANSDLSGIKIRLKAREMAKEMHIHNFDGTMSWCCRFMRRKNIVLRPHKTLSKEEDALQQMNESLKSFQKSVPKKQVLEDNLEKFVVVNTEKASRYSDTVHNVQSTDALKMEPDWEVQSTEVSEREPLWDVQSAEAQKMEPILNLQTNDTLERDSNCDFQSAETQEMEPDWVVQLAEAPESGPLSEVQSNKALEMEPIVSLQSSDSSKRDINIDFKSAEALESELISDLQSIDSPERELNCDFQSVVTEAPVKESTREFQTTDLLQKEPKQDLQSKEGKKRPSNGQVGNKGTKVPLVQSRKSYTAGFKLEVIAFAEKNGGNMAAERKFGVSEKVIRGWRKQKTALQQTKTSKKSFRGHAAQWPDLEDKLADYVMEQRAANRDLSGIKIRLKAREIAKEMQIHNFDGTVSWCFRFMKRKKIVLRPHKTLPKEKDALKQMNESLKSFQGSVAKKQVLENNLEKFVVVNSEAASRYPKEAQKLESILSTGIQSNDSSEKDTNSDFEPAESERELNCDFQSVVAEAPVKESTGEFQTTDSLQKEPEQNLQSNEAKKRPSNGQFSNKGTKVPRRKSRKSYTAGFKLEVIAFAEKNGGNMAAERKFGVNEKVIRGWRKQKTALQQTEKSKKSFRGHAAQWPDLEDKLEEYVMEQRAASRRLSGVKIRLKAREMAKEMQIHNFDGTPSWCFRFMKRKNIVLR